MENMATTGSGSTESKFRTLRALFITGYVLNIILWFVPSVRYFGPGLEGTESRFEGFLGSLSLGMSVVVFDQVLIFASNFVFIALALALPRRWVFITASSVAALFIVVNLISLMGCPFSVLGTRYSVLGGSHCTMTYILVPRVLQGVASLLTLLGFFIKPPAPRPTLSGAEGP